MNFLHSDIILDIASHLDWISYINLRTVSKLFSNALKYKSPNLLKMALEYPREAISKAVNEGIIPQQCFAHEKINTIVNKILIENEQINNYPLQTEIGRENMIALVDHIIGIDPIKALKTFRANICDIRVVGAMISHIYRAFNYDNKILFSEFCKSILLTEILNRSVAAFVAIDSLPYVVQIETRELNSHIHHADILIYHFVTTKLQYSYESLRDLLGEKFQRFAYLVDLHRAVHNNRPITRKITVDDLLSSYSTILTNCTLEYIKSIADFIDWNQPITANYDILSRLIVFYYVEVFHFIAYNARIDLSAVCRRVRFIIDDTGIGRTMRPEIVSEVTYIVALAPKPRWRELIIATRDLITELNLKYEFNCSILELVDNGTLPRSYLGLLLEGTSEDTEMRVFGSHMLRKDIKLNKVWLPDIDRLFRRIPDYKNISDSSNIALLREHHPEIAEDIIAWMTKV